MNRGKNPLYNQLIDTIDYFGDYYLNLNNNDNNIILDFTLGKFGYDDVPVISYLANLYDRAEDIDIEDSKEWVKNAFNKSKKKMSKLRKKVKKLIKW